jgi:hypothetical protein
VVAILYKKNSEMKRTLRCIGRPMKPTKLYLLRNEDLVEAGEMASGPAYRSKRFPQIQNVVLSS